MGGLISLSSMRGVSAPVAGLVTVHTLLVLLEQSCSPGTFAWIRQKSPTAGKVDTVHVPCPNSKSSKKRRSIVPAFTVTLSIDQPSGFGTSPSEEETWTSLRNTNRKCTGLTLAMIESGICTVAVSHGAPAGPCTAPVHWRIAV